MKTLADFSHSDVERILGIVDRLNDIEVRLEVDGMKLHVRKFGDPAMAATFANVSNGPAAPQPVQPVNAAAYEVERSKTEEALQHQDATPLSDAPAGVQPGLLEVRAPMLGRFFRAPSPSEPSFIEVGSKVKPDDTVCVIEVMKLFNTVRAEVSGTIVEVLVESGAMVEHDAVLFRVSPE